MDISFHNIVHKPQRVSTLRKKAVQYLDTVTEIAREHAYDRPESSLGIAYDTKYQRMVSKAIARLGEVKHVILVGIGGSSLGVEAVYRALRTGKHPSLLVIDSLSQDAFDDLAVLLKKVRNPNDLALIVVSKSGTTTETMLNAERALTMCLETYGDMFHTRTVCIGDAGTPFMQAWKKKKMVCIPIPAIIGGRYSVFTAVGMVPLALLGIDTYNLRKGASDALLPERMGRIAEATTTLVCAAEDGVHTVNFFTFEDRLRTIGYWYRQLLAESIGKEKTRKGKSFAMQLLPIVSTAVDLHSMTELYLGGYAHLYTRFVTAPSDNSYTAPASHWLLAHVPHLAGKRHDSVTDAITHGVLRACDDRALPYDHTKLDVLNEYEIGQFLATCMAEVMCLAHLFDVDAFHQPSVERYKKHTRTLLES